MSFFKVFQMIPLSGWSNLAEISTCLPLYSSTFPLLSLSLTVINRGDHKSQWESNQGQEVDQRRKKGTGERENWSFSDRESLRGSWNYGTPTKRQVSKRQVSKRLVSKRLVSKRQVSKRQFYKTSGLQNIRFQNVWFQNVQFLNFIYLLNKKYRNFQVCFPI